ncbi:SMP-30/gluconolactonase/LRE family protein [Actinophytocola sp.]|uniref:SMP-30/gluconolactonase/LRE family protein n=1 Tax=Actinophytocola sp. TaxID=1872138 RepID=UPI003899F5C6
MDVLLTGRGLLESIRWHDGRLYVSDWSAGEVLAVPGGVLASVRSLPLCFDFLPDGSLVIVDSAAGRLRGPDVDLGRTGWNDIAVDGHGHIYVNRPDFTAPAGTIHLAGYGEVAGDLAFPNGMAVTGDTLIVAESHGHRLTAFDIASDGTLSGRRVWAELGAGTPDGICVDDDGAVWYADVPNQCCVRVAAGGEVLRTVQLDRGGFDCVVGGGTLYVAAAEWRGMAEDEMVTPGSGQVLSVPL